MLKLEGSLKETLNNLKPSVKIQSKKKFSIPPLNSFNHLKRILNR